jgi:hypothetical protein
VSICRIKGLSCLIFTEDIIYQHAIKITSISSIFKISLFPKFTMNVRAGLCFFIKLKLIIIECFKEFYLLILNMHNFEKNTENKKNILIKKF